MGVGHGLPYNTTVRFSNWTHHAALSVAACNRYTHDANQALIPPANFPLHRHSSRGGFTTTKPCAPAD